MITWIKVESAEPFVIVCYGDYQKELAYCRLDRDPFIYTKTIEQNTEFPKQYPEITLTQFMRLHTKEV